MLRCPEPEEGPKAYSCGDQPSPGVSWGLMLFAIKRSNLSVSVFATHFKIGSGGQELMMDFFLFIYFAYWQI